MGAGVREGEVGKGARGGALSFCTDEENSLSRPRGPEQLVPSGLAKRLGA